MKAVQIVEWGKLELKEVPIPKPGTNQILVKVHYAPINPSDVMSVKGGYPSGFVIPCSAGFEGSGEVVAVGEGLVVPHKIGDKVSIVTGGTWAEYAVVVSFMATPMLSENTFQDAACHFVNPGTVYCFLDLLKKQNKKSVIHTAGASALGKMLIKACKAEGIKTINIVRNKKYFPELTELGSDYNLDMTDKDFKTDLAKVAKEFDATVCFEAVAGELTAQLSTGMPEGSTIYVYGGLSGFTCNGISVGDLIFRRQTVTGFWLSAYSKTFSPTEIGLMGQTIQKGLKTIYKTETKEFLPSEFEKAIEHSNNSASIAKALFKFN